MDIITQDAINYFNLFKVPNSHGDMVTLPIMHDEGKDKEWMVPSQPFYEVVIGRGFMEEGQFHELARRYRDRAMTETECQWLVEVKFLHPTDPRKTKFLFGSTTILELLKEKEFEGKFTLQVNHFSHMPPIGLTSSDNQVNQVFPSRLPECTIEGEALLANYSLHATHPSYWEEDTMWSQQIDAMGTALETPPLTHSGSMSALGATTIDAIIQTMSELAGFAINHMRMEPTIEHAMDATLVSQFLAFRLKRDNSPATLMKLLQHIKYVVTFIMECPCPGTKAWSTMHSFTLHTWLRNVVAKQRRGVEEWNEAHPEKRARVDVDVAPVWEHVEAKFKACMEQYEVSHGHACAW